jgi:hypothetical protein
VSGAPWRPRGHLVDWTTQQWVCATGRRVALEECSWLEGPVGDPARIGGDFFDRYARDLGLTARATEPAGLLTDFESLRGGGFDPSAVAPSVAAFYTRTSEYDIDAWSQWSGVFWPFGWALAAIFSRRLQQLNVPLRGLDTSRGMTSRVVPYTNKSGAHAFTAWVRELAGTGHVIYAGAYGTCVVPDCDRPCVRVVFPLPNGNAQVIMRPETHADGSLTLVSAGERFGGPGFYFTVHDGPDRVRARYLRTLRETIHVYDAGDGVRADHVLTLWGLTFLRVHYRLRSRGQARPTVAADEYNEAAG